MDRHRFNQLTVSLATTSSRRKVLAGLAVGLLWAGLGRSSVEAAKVRCPADGDCRAIAPGGGTNSCLIGVCGADGYCQFTRNTSFCTDKTKNVCCSMGSYKAGQCQGNARACSG